jgi:hypothetical protein
MKLLLVEESRLFTCIFLSDSILRGTPGCALPFIKFCLFLAYASLEFILENISLVQDVSHTYVFLYTNLDCFL